jgi:hypothetical protein
MTPLHFVTFLMATDVDVPEDIVLWFPVYVLFLNEFGTGLDGGKWTRMDLLNRNISSKSGKTMKPGKVRS